MLKNMNFSKFCIIISIYIILILIIINNVCSFFIVKGNSMLPTIQNKDIKLVNKLVRNYKRGDIVIVKNNQGKYLMIKRIIGLPNEKIDVLEDKTYINGKRIAEPYVKKSSEKPDYYIKNIELKSDEYFVMGDNRCDSIDSRKLGPLRKSDIIGRCF